MNYFIVEESPIYKKFMIYPNHTSLKIGATSGSYSVLGARLFGLHYHDYLRMCRDVYGAVLIGKNCYYPNVLFDTKEQAEKMANDLDKIVKKLKKE